MAIKQEDLMKALLAKINDIVTGGDGNVPTKSNTHYISWCAPGMPFTPGDFEFCSQGITGVVRTQPQPVLPDGSTPAPTGPATDRNGDTEATKTLKLIGQAADFSLFADHIPEKSSIYRTSQERLSKICENVLRMSKVVKSPVTPAEEKQIKKFRDLMYKQVEKEDIITGEKEMLTVESPMMVAYNEMMQAYEDAALLYNMKRVNASSAVDRASVLDFATNASIYYNKVKAAKNGWVAKGYRNEVEKMNAYINAIGRRDLSLWKEGLIDNMEKARLTDPTSGSDFYYTSLFPRNFATSKGWTQFSFAEGEYSSYSNKTMSKWGGGGGLNLGFFSIGGSAGGQKTTTNFNVNMANFKMTFELTQTMISRPWFPAEFFSNVGWTLDPASWTFDGGKLPLTTGGDNPEGPFIAYPTAALFARNIHITFGTSTAEGSTLDKNIHGGGFVGFGPFVAGGSYQRGESERKFDSSYKADGLHVPGMCLIGVVNKMFPTKLPNLDSSIKKEQLQ